MDLAFVICAGRGLLGVSLGDGDAETSLGDADRVEGALELAGDVHDASRVVEFATVSERAA